ncbi:hypothetical protein [Niallia taxi]|uniref:hypothetical protein n=1 Tax=Niallia taxi TaxID=2499688 RepID=UPI0015F6BA81|nr:hypothetical protein [Niallia taxi]
MIEVIILTGMYLGVSFLLHIVSFLCIFLLFQKRSVERLNLPSMEEDVETIHQSIQAFAEELEKENEALYKSLVQYVNKKVGRLEGEVESFHESLSKIQTELNHKQAAPIQINQPVEHFSQKPLEQPAPIVAPSITEESAPISDEPATDDLDPKFKKGIQLYQEGKTAEEIAKSLNINPIEASFIVNYAKKLDS